MQKRNFLHLLATNGLLLGASGLLSACTKEGPAFRGVDISGADYARDFSLSDHNGQLRTLKDFPGKVIVVFFGYTQCPDVCPTSLQELAEAKKLLGNDGQNLQGIFISVDPARDQTAMLKEYMVNFDPSFLALRPTPEQLPALTKEFKIYYKKVDGATPTSYTLDHSAGSYIYDTTGKLRVYARYGSGAPTLAEDIRTLLHSKP